MRNILEKNTSYIAALPNTVVTSLLVFDHKCSWFELRCVSYIKYALDFKNLV